MSKVWLHYKQQNISLRKRNGHNNHRPRLFLLLFRSLNYLSRSPECYSFMSLDYSLTLHFHPRLAFLLYERTFPGTFSCKTPFPLRTLFKLVLLFIYTCSGSTIWTVSETVLDPAACKIPDVVPISRCMCKWSKLFQPWLFCWKRSQDFSHVLMVLSSLRLQFYLSLLTADLSGIVNRGRTCYKGRALDCKARVGGFSTSGTDQYWGS